MPRFVILEHDHPTLHWDLMLETGDALKTWRLSREPLAGLVEAEAIADHRLAYLDYEGPVSGNRGSVKRWDAGTFIEDADSTPDCRRLHFEGQRVRGIVLLAQLASGQWRWEPITA